ncbi:MAG: hypothetical protein HYV18_00165 [Gammaproteobacteria bacterium]|nr:hypothetical protein [Gammaproteobacteria bacterium]
MKLRDMLVLGAVTAAFAMPWSAFADQYLPVTVSCKVTQELCERLPPGDERELCMAAADYVDPRVENACDDVQDIVRPNAQAGAGAGTGCSDQYPGVAPLQWTDGDLGFKPPVGAGLMCCDVILLS